MEILIDNQKVVDVPLYSVDGEDGLVEIISLISVFDVLEVWRSLDGEHRAFRFGGPSDDPSPCELHIAWVTAAGMLTFETVDPFWDGREVHNGYDMELIAGALPTDMLKWGDK